MALRNQPYFPLYVNDVLTDEKLAECSAEAHGIYFRLLCLLHKQETYGLLCLKQKHKQTASKFQNFACILARQMPFEAKQIAKSLQELHEEKVIIVEDDELYQKRMVKDGNISIMRVENGKKGGSAITKQYGKSGFLYLMSDGDSKHKIGISKNVKNKLYRLRSDLKLSKSFDIQECVNVTDMGAYEDAVHIFFNGSMNGEWVTGEFNQIKAKFNEFVLLEAKTKQNTEFEIDNTNDIDINNKAIKKYKYHDIEEEVLVLINSFTKNECLKKAIIDFVEHRKISAPPALTFRALQLFLMELKNTGASEQEQARMLNRAISGGWKTIYPPKTLVKEQDDYTAKVARGEINLD